jgi:CHAD domain-containing protein
MELDYVKLREIKPALSDYIRTSLSLLKESSVPDEKTVHSIRILMKKSRAVIRLLVTQIDDETFTRENLAFRQVGRKLCPLRDSSVLRKTLKDLRKKNEDIFSRLEDNEKINLLLKKSDSDNELSEECRLNLLEVNEILKKAVYRIRFQSMGNLNPQAMLKELEMTYNNVADNYLKCKNQPKPASIHEFRKRVKDFLYQLYFFRPLNTSVVKGLEKKLDVMAQNLGKFNDLVNIEKTLDYKYKASQNPPELDELMIIIREEQDRYLAKVWPVAYKIFCPGQKLINILGFRILII